jgi:hypothetical protein
VKLRKTDLYKVNRCWSSLQKTPEFAEFVDIETLHLLGPGTSGISDAQEQVESGPASPSYITGIRSKALSMFGTGPNANSYDPGILSESDEHSTIPDLLNGPLRG